MESNLVVMKRFTLQAQLKLQDKQQQGAGELGEFPTEMPMAGKKKRNDMEGGEEDQDDCCGTMMMIPAPIPASLPHHPPTVSASAIPPVGPTAPIVGNGINKKRELITQMTKILSVDTTGGGYFQQHYRLQSTTTTNTTVTVTTTKVTTELNSTTIKSLEQQQDHHHPHHLHHHHHEPLHHSGGTSSTASSVSSASFYSSEDADVLSSAPTTPVNEKVQMNFPIVIGNNEEEKEMFESNLVLPSATVAITPANAIHALPSTKLPPRPTVEEVTDDELVTKEPLQVWHDIKEDDSGALGDDDDSEESDEDELEDETDSGEEDDDEEEDETDDEQEVWETDDEGVAHHHVEFTAEVSEISMGGFVFGYSDGEEEDETDSEDGEFEDEDDEDDADCTNDGLFGYDSAEDSDDEENSDEEEEADQGTQILFPFLEESPCPMRRINSHRQFDRPPLRPCLSTVSMKREDSNCSSNSGGSRVRFSETAERPQIIKTTHFRYSYYEFEAHLKSSECSSELKSTFDDTRTEMEKFQEINFLRESYISLLDDDDAARERENPSNSIVGKVEHILLSKAMESRGEDCKLEDIGLASGNNKSNFCTDALFALIGGKIKLSEINRKEHAKGDQAPPSTPVASPDASGDEWETDCDEDDEE